MRDQVWNCSIRKLFADSSIHRLLYYQHHRSNQYTTRKSYLGNQSKHLAILQRHNQYPKKRHHQGNSCYYHYQYRLTGHQSLLDMRLSRHQLFHLDSSQEYPHKPQTKKGCYNLCWHYTIGYPYSSLQLRSRRMKRYHLHQFCPSQQPNILDHVLA